MTHSFHLSHFCTLSADVYMLIRHINCRQLKLVAILLRSVAKDVITKNYIYFQIIIHLLVNMYMINTPTFFH